MGVAMQCSRTNSYEADYQLCRIEWYDSYDHCQHEVQIQLPVEISRTVNTNNNHNKFITTNYHSAFMSLRGIQKSYYFKNDKLEHGT